MVNLAEIRTMVGRGDYTAIARIFNAKHDSDNKSVSVSYVGKIIRGERAVAPGSYSEEIVSIAREYLFKKKRFNEQLIEMELT